jgi:transcriptional regulator
MYVPRHFAMDGLAEQHALIEANDFGVLVVNGPDGLFATHVPMMLKRDEGELGTLYAHLAKANPHAQMLGREMLAVFSGAHGYISPTWYSDRSTNVPTWNYSAVHCHGVAEPIAGETLPLLDEMTDVYEKARPQGWSVSELKAEIRETLPRAVVGLRMEITRIEGKAKLSQNKPRAERERLINGLKAAGDISLAAIMEQQPNSN